MKLRLIRQGPGMCVSYLRLQCHSRCVCLAVSYRHQRDYSSYCHTLLLCSQRLRLGPKLLLYHNVTQTNQLKSTESSIQVSPLKTNDNQKTPQFNNMKSVYFLNKCLFLFVIYIYISCIQNHFGKHVLKSVIFGHSTFLKT